LIKFSIFWFFDLEYFKYFLPLNLRDNTWPVFVQIAAGESGSCVFKWFMIEVAEAK